MNKYCKGCPTGKNICREDNGEGKCPCTNCLVKSMCEHACQEFIKFEEKVGRRLQGILLK